MYRCKFSQFFSFCAVVFPILSIAVALNALQVVDNHGHKQIDENERLQNDECDKKHNGGGIALLGNRIIINRVPVIQSDHGKERVNREEDGAKASRVNLTKENTRNNGKYICTFVRQALWEDEVEAMSVHRIRKSSNNVLPMAGRERINAETITCNFLRNVIARRARSARSARNARNTRSKR